MMTGEDKGPQV